MMIERIWSALSDTEICLVTPMLANSEVQGFYCRQAEFEFEYLTLLISLLSRPSKYLRCQDERIVDIQLQRYGVS